MSSGEVERLRAAIIEVRDVIEPAMRSSNYPCYYLARRVEAVLAAALAESSSDTRERQP